MTSASWIRSKGFSLIELLVVLAIIAIVSAASIPAGLNYVRNYEVTGSAQNVATQMQAARAQAVKRNTQRGILLNFNYPQDRQYQFTSLDPNPMTGNWGGGVYPVFAPLTYQEGMIDFGAVPDASTGQNVLHPNPAAGIMSPHGNPIPLTGLVEFLPGGFNALLFRSDGSVRPVNAEGGRAAAVSVVGVNFQVRIQDPNTGLTRTITISRNGRVTVTQP